MLTSSAHTMISDGELFCRKSSILVVVKLHILCVTVSIRDAITSDVEGHLRSIS